MRRPLEPLDLIVRKGQNTLRKQSRSLREARELSLNTN